MKPSAFSGASVETYAAGPPRQVPGFDGLHRMTSLLLAERTPPDGRVLVLGAGGGLEIRALADRHPGWSFDGVDPSGDMLRLAERTIGAQGGRVRLHEGYAEDAPDGPFDAAVSLLTLHFVPRAARTPTLAELHRRMRPGAPLVVAHRSFAQGEPERSLWIARDVAFGAPEGADATQLAASREAIASRLSILAPEEDEASLRAAGFADVTLFYAGLGFRGWAAYA